MNEQTLKPESTNHQRRRFLVATTTLIGSVGLLGVAVPFISYMNPSASVRSAGAPVDIDISKLEPAQQITVSWRGKPVWVLRRTPQILEDLHSDAFQERLLDPDSSLTSQQPDYAQNVNRSVNEEFLVVIAICTHLGCVPSFRPDRAPADLGPDWIGGYFCPCHGSKFDFAGRIYKAMPAPSNLVIPPYRFLSESVIRVGEDTVPG